MRFRPPYQLTGNPGQQRMLLLGCLLTGLAASGHAAARAVVHIVTIQAMQFSPENLEVAAGDTVIWVNKDPFPHTATSDKKGFDSKEVLPGKKWIYIAGQPGLFPYTCIFHRTNKGSLIVKQRQ